MRKFFKEPTLASVYGSTKAGLKSNKACAKRGTEFIERVARWVAYGFFSERLHEEIVMLIGSDPTQIERRAKRYGGFLLKQYCFWNK